MIKILEWQCEKENCKDFGECIATAPCMCMRIDIGHCGRNCRENNECLFKKEKGILEN